MTLFKKTADRTPTQVAKTLREFIAGTGGERDWDDFESVPISDPTLEAIRREAVTTGPPNSDLTKLSALLVRAEALLVTYAPRIVLQLPVANPDALAPFVETCLRDKVRLIAIVGDGCREAEDMIDDLIIGDGTASDRYITTSSHPEESLQDALDFAAAFSSEEEAGVQLVRF